MSPAERPAPSNPGHGAPSIGVSMLARFRQFTQALNVAGTLLILVMAVAVNADIGGRDFFNHPIPGVNEFIGLSIVAVVFLQMSNTLLEDRHVSNDIFIRVIAETHPRLSAGIYAVFHAIGAALMAIIVVYVWPIVVENYQGEYYAGTAGVVEIPIWPFLSTVVVGAATTSIQFLLDAGRYGLRAAGRGSA